MLATVETLEIKGIDYAVEMLPGRSVALHRGRKTYVVSQGADRTTCDCPDFAIRKAHLDGNPICKHIKAVCEAGLIGLAHDADDEPTVERQELVASEPAFTLSSEPARKPFDRFAVLRSYLGRQWTPAEYAQLRRVYAMNWNVGQSYGSEIHDEIVAISEAYESIFAEGERINREWAEWSRVVATAPKAARVKVETPVVEPVKVETVAPVKAEAPAFKLSRPDHQFKLGLTDAPKAPASLAERYRPRVLRDMVGQGLATFRLESFLEAPYSTAFLFDGPTGVGKTTAALAIAAELGAVEFGGLDIIKSGTQDAEAVESALNSLRFAPMLGSGWKVVIVDEADYMSPKASQVWLSALEDLPTRSVIIFTTNNPGKFPDRFIDRCERISFEADATIHSQDAQALIDWIWHEEVGGANGPDFATLANVVDKGGQLSYRRVIRALEPLIARGKAETPAPAPVVEPAPEPEPAPVATEPPIESQASEPATESQASESIDLAAEFKAGVTIAELARKLGISTTTVRRRLEKAGIALPKRSAKAETVIVEPIAVEPTPEPEPEPVATLASEAPAVPCNPLFGTDPEYTLIITIAPHFEPWALSVLDCHPAGIVDDSTCDVYLVVEPYPADRTPEPEPTTEGDDKAERRAAFEAKRVRRIERIRERAARKASEGDRAHAAADRIASFIPFGQPILIGHHSEKRHRRDLDKIHRLTGKGFELQREAKRLETRADAAENNDAIRSDDPDAIDKLREKLGRLGTLQDHMKAVNAAIRRHKTPERRIVAIVELGVPETRAHELLRPDFAGRIGYPDYALQNNNAEIGRVKDRIKSLERAATIADQEWNGDGCTVRLTCENGRPELTVRHDAKPPQETRASLKSNGFRWVPSLGFWRSSDNWHRRRYAVAMTGASPEAAHA